LRKKILQRNEQRKKISCRAFRREKDILPTRLLEKKILLTRNHPSPTPLQELNGRPLIRLLSVYSQAKGSVPLEITLMN